MNVASSFYDGLNKLVIGFLILFPFIDFCSKGNDEIATISLIVFCWLIGIFLWAFLKSLSFICLSKFNLSHLFKSIPLPKKNNIDWINHEYHSASEDVGCKYIIKGKSTPIDNLELNDYYTIYYAVQRNGLLGSVPILESYSAFFSNLPFVFLWYIILILTGIWQNNPITTRCCAIAVFLGLTLVSMYFRKVIEHKIFSSVLHAYLLGVKNKNNIKSIKTN